MNLLENINSFLVESSRNSTIYHKQSSKHHENISKINKLEKKLKGEILPLSDNDNFRFIETDNKCNDCSNIASFVSNENSRLYYCWKHSLQKCQE